MNANEREWNGGEDRCYFLRRMKKAAMVRPIRFSITMMTSKVSILAMASMATLLHRVTAGRNGSLKAAMAPRLVAHREAIRNHSRS